MSEQVLGIHHVTGISANIRGNLDFYTGPLGLRLVKKSVNQDDVKAYHLFYADAVASPGTDVTFFDWPGTPPNVPGAGTVALTTLRAADAEAVGWWESRLEAGGVLTVRDADPSGRGRVVFADPEGQRLAIVDGGGLPGETVPWDAAVPAERALRGILGVDLDSPRPAETREFLSRYLGFEMVSEGDVVTMAVRGEDSAGEVVVRESRRAGRAGAGGMHHVAFRVRDDDELRGFERRLEEAGMRTSGYVDRYYFHSLYFREPGGVLFELATDGPGMAIDEAPGELGARVSLPPFLAGRRAEIEAGLVPL